MGRHRLTDNERGRLVALPEIPPDWVEAGVPEWMAPTFQAQFGDDWISECRAAIIGRAPVDLRVKHALGAR